jgi:hypothetical protein
MSTRDTCDSLFATVAGELVVCSRVPGHLGMHRRGRKVPCPPRELEAREVPAMICKFVLEQKGEHVHMRVFVGNTRHSLGKAGELVMRVGEWQLFGAALGLGSRQTMGHLEVELEGELNV